MGKKGGKKPKIAKEKHTESCLVVTSDILGTKYIDSTIRSLYNSNGKSSKPFMYNKNQYILLVGEGDFSFALGLAIRMETASRILATSYDPLQELTKKYPDVTINIQSFTADAYSGSVLHRIDATKLDKYTKLFRKTIHDKDGFSGIFDRIVFNFPHLGGGSTLETIQKNQELISKFLLSSKYLLNHNHGEIHITLRQTVFYERWKIKDVAANCGYSCVKEEKFDPGQYGRYLPQRTEPSITRNIAPSANSSTTYVFKLDQNMKRKRNEYGRKEETSETEYDEHEEKDDVKHQPPDNIASRKRSKSGTDQPAYNNKSKKKFKEGTDVGYKLGDGSLLMFVSKQNKGKN